MVDLEQDSCENSSVGDWPREARERRGESLEDASRITRIGKSYLAAIEEGDLRKLPSDAYARGFVRLYANHLGLSGDEALCRLTVNSPAGERDAAAPDPGSNNNRRSIGKKRWAIPIFLLIVLAVATVPRMKQERSEPTVAAPVVQPAATIAVERQSAPDPAKNDLQATVPLPANGDIQAADAKITPSAGIVLRLKAVQNGKLHITIDGSVSQEYELNVGDLVEWKGETMFLLELDNAGSVEGELNGKPLQPFGDPGQSVHLSINADGVHKD